MPTPRPGTRARRAARPTPSGPSSPPTSPLTTFLRSNGSRPPCDFTTVSGAWSTRSNVVNRWAHVRHSRRRRIAVASSATRESTTLVSSAWQTGIARPDDTRFIDRRTGRAGSQRARPLTAAGPPGRSARRCRRSGRSAHRRSDRARRRRGAPRRSTTACRRPRRRGRAGVDEIAGSAWEAEAGRPPRPASRTNTADQRRSRRRAASATSARHVGRRSSARGAAQRRRAAERAGRAIDGKGWTDEW